MLRYAEERIVERAREDVNAFIEYVGFNTAAKVPGGHVPKIVQAPFHVELQQLLADHRYLAVMTPPRTGKTTQIELRTIWEIGHNPDLRIAVVSKTKGSQSTAAKISQRMRDMVDFSPEIKKVFPHLHRGNKWEQSRWRVRRSTYSERDYTCQVAAPPGFILGSRIDRYIFDDFYDAASVRTEKDRRRLLDWFFKMLDRLDPTDGRVILACNPFHPRDPWHELERDMIRKPDQSIWHCVKYPIYRPPVYDIDLDEVEFTIPEFWSRELVEIERNKLPPLEFSRSFLAQATDDKESPFNQPEVRRLFRYPHHPDGGGGASAFESISLEQQRELGCHVVIGVDLAARKHAKADMTAFAVVVLWPRDHVYQLVWLESGRWRSDETGRHLIDLNQRFAPAVILVENNGAQDMIFQVLEGLLEIDRLKAGEETVVPIPPVRPFTTTGSNKSDPVNGVEGLSAEIDRGQWVFPATSPRQPVGCHSALMFLQDEILSYSRGSHTGDHLMAMWLAREAARGLLWADSEQLQERFDDVPEVFEPRDGDEPDSDIHVFGAVDDDD
jgi:hypothetical protein